MPDSEATTVARILVNEFICRFGVPEQLHTDQGRNFESTLIKQICQLLGIRKTRTTPYHPQSDGMVERFNRTLLSLLSIATEECEEDWDLKLPTIMMAYRSRSRNCRARRRREIHKTTLLLDTNYLVHIPGMSVISCMVCPLRPRTSPSWMAFSSSSPPIMDSTLS